MQLFDVVNTIGATVYFVIFILYLWLQQLPRMRDGSGCWALSILCFLLTRLTLLLLDDLDDKAAMTSFITLNMTGNFFLLVGALKFFAQSAYIKPFTSTSLVILAVTISLVYWSETRIYYALLFSLYNVILFLWLAGLLYQDKPQLNSVGLKVALVFSVIFALHWGSYPLLFQQTAVLPIAFLTGNLYTFIIHLAFITFILSEFQKRLVASEQKALDMAYHDSLTGLYNKRYMTTLFDQALLLAKRPHQMLAVIYIDLDNFKPVNDVAGHDIGDLVLKEVAHRLEQNTRSTDICARIGGDEFIVIVTHINQENHVREITQNLLKAISQPIPLEQAQATFTISASAGISMYPNHGQSLEELLFIADKTMYEVKHSEKGKFRVCEA